MDDTIFKILLVDDEEDILEFISYNLQKEGYKVFTAKNGVEAVKSAETNIPHLVILDVMMPEMDGIAACEEMRKIPALDNTIIAFLTARGEDYSQIAGFEAGADDYITKPVRPKVLVSRVKALLKRTGEATVAPVPVNEHTVSVGNLVMSLEDQNFKNLLVHWLDKVQKKASLLRRLILPRKQLNILLEMKLRLF